MKHKCSRLNVFDPESLCGKPATLFYVVHGAFEDKTQCVPMARCAEHEVTPDGAKWLVSKEIYEVACVMES